MDYIFIDADADFGKTNKIQDMVYTNLIKYGMTLSGSYAIPFSTANLINLIDFADTELIMVKLSQDHRLNLAIKEAICSNFKTFLVKNNACSFAIESYLRLYNGSSVAGEFESESLIPDGTEALASDLGLVQGFMLNVNKKHIIFLPPTDEQVLDLIDNKLPLVFNRLYNTPTDFIYLRLFGIREDMVRKNLRHFENNSLGVSIMSMTNGLDTTLTIGYQARKQGSELDEFVAKVCETFRNNIYSTDNEDICQVAMDLIKMTGKKIALVESLTNGQIYTRLLDCNNIVAKNSIETHLVINEISDTYGLSVDKNLLSVNGIHSVDSIYEIATAILSDFKSDIVVVSMANYDKSDCATASFVAIGDTEGIHIYKSVYHGDKELTNDTIFKNVCYYIIRKLKQNSLIFDQSLAK